MSAATGYLENRSQSCRFILPRKSANIVYRLFEDNDSILSIRADTHNCSISNINDNGIVFTSKLIAEKYPDYKRHIDIKSEKIFTADTKELKAALLRVEGIATENHEAVRVEIKDNQLLLESTNYALDIVEEKISANIHDSSPLEIGLNRRYMLAILNSTSSDKVTFRSDKERRRVFLECTQDKHCKHMLMPVRLWN